jgi:hypothetical protein
MSSLTAPDSTGDGHDIDEDMLTKILNEVDEDIDIDEYTFGTSPIHDIVPEQQVPFRTCYTHKKIKEEPPPITVQDHEEETYDDDEEEKVNELLLELDVDDEQDDDFIANLQMHATGILIII